MNLIAEDLLLLLLDDEKGSLAASDKVDAALGGAVLAELALTGAVTVDERTSRWVAPKVRATEHAPEDRVLIDAQATVAEKDRSAQDLVTKIGKGLKDDLADRLAERGILERRRDRVLGLLPRTRWPALDTTHEDAVRRALTDCLVQGLDARRAHRRAGRAALGHRPGPQGDRPRRHVQART